MKLRPGWWDRRTWQLWYALRHPEVPWTAKLIPVLVLIYVLSPLDLIPDVLLGLGWLDDLVILPLGMNLAWRLVPVHLRPILEARAARARLPRLVRWAVRIAVVLLVLALVAGSYALWRWWQG